MGEELIRLGAHEYFGERALLTSEPRTANIIAVGYVECLVLERSSFQTLLTDVQEDLEQNIAMQGSAKEGGVTEEEDAEVHGPSTSYSYNELEIMRTIGTGTFGRVKLVRHSPTGQVCAL